jgi:hypothetical protein
MNEEIDAAVWRAFEHSAVVRAIEHTVRRLKAAADASLTLAQLRSWQPALAGKIGHVVVIAALTHMVLMLGIARPVSWQWGILPAIALLAGAMMIAGSRPHTKP